MPLGYRSIFTVRAGQDPVRIAAEQFRSGYAKSTPTRSRSLPVCTKLGKLSCSRSLNCTRRMARKRSGTG